MRPHWPPNSVKYMKPSAQEPGAISRYVQFPSRPPSDTMQVYEAGQDCQGAVEEAEEALADRHHCGHPAPAHGMTVAPSYTPQCPAHRSCTMSSSAWKVEHPSGAAMTSGTLANIS